MSDYVFQFVDKVIFHVGTENYRSQGAMAKLKAKKIREIEIAYFGEPTRKMWNMKLKKIGLGSEFRGNLKCIKGEMTAVKRKSPP